MGRSKGRVTICSLRGRLRLRLPREVYRGQQVYFSLSLSDTPENRAIAAERAAQIQKDIVWGIFDPSLEKYRSPNFDPPRIYTIGEIFKSYFDYKWPQIAKSTRRNFSTVAARLENWRSARLEDAPKLKNWLLENYSPDATRRTIAKLSAACNWAIEEGMIDRNPFEAIQVRSSKKRNINPFTAAERDRIIEGFKQSEKSSYYAPLVDFLFATGCRPSEAVALRWENISLGFERITFAQAYVEGQRKSTKTGTIRTFPVNASLKQFLTVHARKTHPHCELVFPSQKKAEISFRNFTRRHWRSILADLKIAYRKPYSTRHTFITLALDAGVPVKQVAQWVGNSPEIIFKHYAGLTRSEVPEL